MTLSGQSVNVKNNLTVIACEIEIKKKEKKHIKMISVKTVIVIATFIYTSCKYYQYYKYDKRSRIPNRYWYSEYPLLFIHDIKKIVAFFLDHPKILWQIIILYCSVWNICVTLIRSFQYNAPFDTMLWQYSSMQLQ